SPLDVFRIETEVLTIAHANSGVRGSWMPSTSASSSQIRRAASAPSSALRLAAVLRFSSALSAICTPAAIRPDCPPGAHHAQSEPEMARDRFGFLERHARQCPVDTRSLAVALLSRFAPRAGLVTLRQTFVRRSHGGNCPCEGAQG